MPLRADTRDAQSDLAKYTRTGKDVELDGITPGRIHHYRRLIFNTVKNSLTNAYPLARKILGKDQWNNLVDQFFSQHDSAEPQIWRMPVLLYEFVRDNDVELKSKYEFLTDLLLFEWIEIEIYVMEDIEVESYLDQGDFLDDIIVLNPHHRLDVLDWPVHRKAAKNIDKEDKSKYFLLTFRHPEKLSVRFHNLGPFHAFLVEQLAVGEYSLREILEAATEIFKNPFEDLSKNAFSFLTTMQNKGFVLGFQKV